MSNFASLKDDYKPSISKDMKYLITSMAWLLLTVCAQANEKFCIAEDLELLDQTVELKATYDQAKQREITRYKLSEGNYISAIDRYTYQELLYQEYQKWNPDSAIIHAQACKKLAADNGWVDLYKKACIHEAYVHVICGELLEASMLIKDMGTIREMSKENQLQMAILMLEFDLRSKIKNFENKLTKSCLHTWNTYSPYLPKSNWRYNYYKSMVARRGSIAELSAQLNHCKQPSFEAAAIAVAISQLYYHKKDYNSYIHYLIISAINDIKCGNHEASSLVYLINSPHVNLCPNQAFRYAMLCTENVKTFKDQGRSFDVVNAYAKITQSYQDSWQRRTNTLYCIIILLAGAIVAIGFLLRNISKRNKQKGMLLQKLEASNISLEDMIAKEKQAQEALQESNRLLHNEINYHNQNFFNVYHLVTKYITDVQDFKKMVFNLITAGKYDKARKELNANTSTEKYLKEFFEHFDQAFLLSHPDFVSKFNALLRPECRITPPSKNMLTPELRIYALVSIGITDSVSIAQFLHYSPQTVYNYRLKVRHSACIEEKNFADTVAKMYENVK